MPTFKDLTVHVTDANNTPLREWGTSKHDRSRLSFCHIESKVGMTFRIVIEPRIRFPDRQVPSSLDQESSDEEVCGIDKLYRNSTSGKLRSSRKAPPKPWHLLATLRLDGRETHEKRVIVHLGKDQPLFLESKGKVIMEGCRRPDGNGGLKWHTWKFTDVGIDVVMDALHLSGAGEGVSGDDDELVAAVQELGATNFEDQEEKSNFGQIEITLERVTVSQNKFGRWVLEEDEDEQASMSAGDITKIAHTATRDDGISTSNRVETIAYSLIDTETQLYAKFKFYYRNAEQLRKYDFPGFPKQLIVNDEDDQEL